MKKFKELNINEQHREKGRFKPTTPHNVPNVAAASPRPSSDSAEVRLKEAAPGDTSNFETPVGNQFRQGDSPAARSMLEKPQKEPMKKYKEVKEESDIEIPKDAPSVEDIAKKHGVSVDEIENQLKIGMSIEAEHGKNKSSQREIAMDHLNEKPDYYKKLKKYVEETEQVNEMLKPKMSALDKFRQASAERAKKHDAIEKEMQARHAAGKEDMKGSIDRLEKSLNREETGLDEDLRKWFDPKHPEGGWKRVNSKGEAIGPCAREPGEPKPKCMSNEKRASLSKKERASAVAAKRKHDPNPERKGEPINVSNFGKGKISEDMENLDEKNVPTSPEKWAQAKSQAKAKFDVYPSAYANGWASKKYKEMGGGWKSVSEAKDDDVGEMVKDKLKIIINRAQDMHDSIKGDASDMPEWVKSKVTLAQDYISTACDYSCGKEQLGEEMKKHPFVAVHAKKGKHETHGSTSYEAAQNAAKHWKMKNTAGIDVYRADKTHVDEEVEQIEEAPVVIKTNKPIGSRVTSIGPGGKETVIKSDPPFEGPYTKVKKTITDKSGAKHSPMSRAKDLARMALSKQSKALKPVVKEEKDDSRKAEIVKNVMKSAKKKKSESAGDDKFESEPVLSSEIQKQ